MGEVPLYLQVRIWLAMSTSCGVDRPCTKESCAAHRGHPDSGFTVYRGTSLIRNNLPPRTSITKESCAAHRWLPASGFAVDGSALRVNHNRPCTKESCAAHRGHPA